MSIDLTKELLDEEWIESASNVQGRRNDVPKPANILKGSPQDQRKVSLTAGDAVFVHDGGRPVVEPKSLGWVEERTESHVTIDCYSKHSIERVEGYRDDNNMSESYGGMKGEIKRIMDKIRGGIREFYMVKATNWNYMHSNEPAGIYRGQWEVTFISYSNIQQDMEMDIDPYS